MSTLKSITNYNYCTISAAVKLLVICWSTISCSSLTKSPEPVEPLGDPKASYSLEIKGSVGRQEMTRYYSHSHIKSFENDQMSRERDEIVEFDVEVKTIKTDKQKGFIHTITKTLEKDGVVELHDLAFPEVNERIELVYKKNADVVYAGTYPRSSVFYIPPLSLPDGPVKVGDTWEMQRSWISRKNAIPLSINLITILKNIYPCGEGQCADLEISGEVGIIAALDASTDFKSEIVGRILFSIDNGTTVWSLIKSNESMRFGENVIEVSSCLLSTLTEPKKEQWEQADKDTCNPTETELIKVPGTTTPSTKQ